MNAAIAWGSTDKPPAGDDQSLARQGRGHGFGLPRRHIFAPVRPDLGDVVPIGSGFSQEAHSPARGDAVERLHRRRLTYGLG
jgi:hypothetical protein